MLLKSCLTLLLSVVLLQAFSQDTLPNFNVIESGNRVVISWTNPYGESIRQLSVQRSYDSTKNFKTIITLPDPTVLQNGYADVMQPGRTFYRIYIMLDGGKYLFSKSQRPDASAKALAGLNGGDHHLLIDTNGLKQPGLKDFSASKYVYTEKDGYVKVFLPDVATKKYRIKFFEEDGTPLFELKSIQERALILDKANFMHAGWFKFELYEDGEVLEKYKFYIPKEF